VHRVFPGLVMLREGLRRCEAFFCDHTFEGCKPMVIIGFSRIGIAGGLSFLDFLAKHRGPLAPGEETYLVKRQGHGESMRFPGSAKDGAVVVARNARNRFGGAPCGFWIYRS